MYNRNRPPEVNAGSMADIAFLLLIFFLVTTTLETDQGIQRKIPKPSDAIGTIAERNVLRIALNANNELLVNNELLPIEQLGKKTTAFLDNGAKEVEGYGFCDYCKGEQLDNSSDHPQKAIVSITTNRQSDYGTFLQVQDQINQAYLNLRNREANRLYGVSFSDLKWDYANKNLTVKEKAKIRAKIETVQQLFPFKLSEATLNLKS